VDIISENVKFIVLGKPNGKGRSSFSSKSGKFRKRKSGQKLD